MRAGESGQLDFVHIVVVADRACQVVVFTGVASRRRTCFVFERGQTLEIRFAQAFFDRMQLIQTQETLSSLID